MKKQAAIAFMFLVFVLNFIYLVNYRGSVYTIESNILYKDKIDPVLLHTKTRSTIQVIVVFKSYECLTKAYTDIAEKGNIIRSFRIVPSILIETQPSKIYSIADYSCVKYILLNDNSIKISSPYWLQQIRQSTISVIENWAVQGVKADKVWSMGYHGEGIRIGLIDSGIDINHPALKYKLFTMIPNDPYYPGGWVELSESGYQRCTIPRDDNGHGTFVASQIVGGDGENITLGIAPKAQLMVAKAFNANGSATPAQVIGAFEWMLDPTYCNGTSTGVKPHIVVFSAGFTGYKGVLLLDLIKKLLENNIIVLAAIGNNGPGISDYPANVWGVFGIGAVNEEKQVPWFSSGENITWTDPPSEWPFKPPYPMNYLKPDFVAPGVDLVGAVPGGTYAEGNGTSYSTGVAAGVTAIVLQALKAYNHTSPVPYKTLPELVYGILTNTSIDLEDPGQDIRAGYGLLDVYSATLLARNLTIHYNLTIEINGTQLHVGDSVKLEITTNASQLNQPQQLLIYFDNYLIAEGQLKPQGTEIVLTIPNATIGSHTITATTPEGKYRGDVEIEVKPSIRLEPTVTWPGTSTIIKAYGLEANQTYQAGIDGELLESQLYTNSQGFGITAITIPRDLGEGTHYVILINAETREPIIQAPIEIISKPNYELLILQQEIYYSNQVTLFIYTSLNDVPIHSNITVKSITPEDSIHDTLIRELTTGLYEVTLNVKSNVTVILLEIHAQTEYANTTFSKDKLALITIDYTSQQLLGSVNRLEDKIKEVIQEAVNINSTLQGLLTNYNNIINILTEMNSTTIERMTKLMKEINYSRSKFNTSIELMKESLINLGMESENNMKILNKINNNMIEIKEYQENQSVTVKQLKEELKDLKSHVKALLLSIYSLIIINIILVIIIIYKVR